MAFDYKSGGVFTGHSNMLRRRNKNFISIWLLRKNLFYQFKQAIRRIPISYNSYCKPVFFYDKAQFIELYVSFPYSFPQIIFIKNF